MRARPGETVDDATTELLERHIRQHPVDFVVGLSEHTREEAEVLSHCEIAVHRRRLRHVPDATAERWGSCRETEDVDDAGGDPLDADDRTDQR